LFSSLPVAEKALNTMRNDRTGASTLENRDFVGKSALIVGGTSGIGKAVARLLLERGAASVIVAGRSVEKLHAAESELSAFGRVVGRDVDITNQTELARVLGESGNQ
jgi:NADP-dependent 3-hydroxy acid dehydrogenase YdfG